MRCRICWILTLALLLTGTASANFSAQAMLAVDGDTGQVYLSRDADVTRPVASTTKLMTLYLIFQAIDRGVLSLDSQISISENAAAVSNDMDYSGGEQFTAGESFPLESLIGMIVTASANGSTVAVAEAVAGSEAAFVEQMNEQAEKWGIDAEFSDCSGILPGAVSARALAVVAAHLAGDYPEIFDYTGKSSVTLGGIEYASTDEFMLGTYTCEGLDGLKTGHTEAAGYCFVGSCLRSGVRIFSVVLGCNTDGERFQDTCAVLDWAYSVAAGEKGAFFQSTLPCGVRVTRYASSAPGEAEDSAARLALAA